VDLKKNLNVNHPRLAALVKHFPCTTEGWESGQHEEYGGKIQKRAREGHCVYCECLTVGPCSSSAVSSFVHAGTPPVIAFQSLFSLRCVFFSFQSALLPFSIRRYYVGLVVCIRVFPHYDFVNGLRQLKKSSQLYPCLREGLLLQNVVGALYCKGRVQSSRTISRQQSHTRHFCTSCHHGYRRMQCTVLELGRQHFRACMLEQDEEALLELKRIFNGTRTLQQHLRTHFLELLPCSRYQGVQFL
jgi:hypothetical protein